MKIEEKNTFGIIGGSPFDTQLGVQLLDSLGLKSRGSSLSKDCLGQNLFQKNSKEQIENIIIDSILNLKKGGNIDYILIYCISLSNLIDISSLEEKTNIKIITPLGAFTKLNLKKNQTLIIAANHQSSCNIGKILKRNNILSIDNIDFVRKIEIGTPIKELLETEFIQTIFKLIKKENIKTLILGCTHFNVLIDQLKTKVDLIESHSYLSHKISQLANGN